jgi:hypothetical protein
MHHVMAWPIVVVAAVLLTGCVNPVGPNPHAVGDPTSIADLARGRPTPPPSAPDSAGIPPSIPPIYEEFPTVLGVPQ